MAAIVVPLERYLNSPTSEVVGTPYQARVV